MSLFNTIMDTLSYITTSNRYYINNNKEYIPYFDTTKKISKNIKSLNSTFKNRKLSAILVGGLGLVGIPASLILGLVGSFGFTVGLFNIPFGGIILEKSLFIIFSAILFGYISTRTASKSYNYYKMNKYMFDRTLF